MGLMDTLKKMFGGGDSSAETPQEETKEEATPQEETTEAPSEEENTQM